MKTRLPATLPAFSLHHFGADERRTRPDGAREQTSNRVALNGMVFRSTSIFSAGRSGLHPNLPACKRQAPILIDLAIAHHGHLPVAGRPQTVRQQPVDLFNTARRNTPQPRTTGHLTNCQGIMTICLVPSCLPQAGSQTASHAAAELASPHSPAPATHDPSDSNPRTSYHPVKYWLSGLIHSKYLKNSLCQINTN